MSNINKASSVEQIVKLCYAVVSAAARCTLKSVDVRNVSVMCCQVKTVCYFANATLYIIRIDKYSAEFIYTFVHYAHVTLLFVLTIKVKSLLCLIINYDATYITKSICHIISSILSCIMRDIHIR